MTIRGRRTAESMRPRIALVGTMLSVVVLAHWLTPTDAVHLHAVHLTLRKLFFLPVILGAVWFGLGGSVITAALSTALYAPHVVYQWGGQVSENLNQLGDLVSIWVVALLAGMLVAREREAQQRTFEAHQGALSALVAALDAREQETERHSLRVAAYAELLGSEMGLEGLDLENLKIAALLHDIGKIGVPDAILLAEGPLDVDAKRLMRRHPEIGFRILQPIRSLEVVSEAVYCHHERYDGFGYPRRLMGPQIPLPARIFSVVDAFDAMTAGRPYRTAMGFESARRRIEEEGGRQFDPDVVEAFLGIPTSSWQELQGAGKPEIRELGRLTTC